MTAAGSETPGLRERAKARRRADIVRAGMRLFAEQGYDKTTIAEIADAAEVSARTVSGYFPGKIEIATALADDMVRSLNERLVAQPRGDLLDILDDWLREVVANRDPESGRLAKAMWDANPALSALTSAHVAEAVETGTAAVARWVGRPKTHPLVSMGIAAMGAVLAEYIRTVDGDTKARALHDSVMTLLRDVLNSVRERP